MADKTGYRTRAQVELLSFLQTEPGRHHTAQDIKDHFDRQGKPIGLATIYRQLDRLVSDGSVQRYLLDTQDSACYAYVDHDQPDQTHFHCKCDKCGRLIHLDCDELRQIQSHLLQEHGFSWNFGKTVFYGTCDQCRAG